MRVMQNEKPYKNEKLTGDEAPWLLSVQWPCSWIGCDVNQSAPFVTAYKKEFTIGKYSKIRVHVSADERYELYLDGTMIGRGSERGDRNNWYFETYELELQPGKHTIVSRTWSYGKLRHCAQVSICPGFIFSPEGEEFIALLGTGTSLWLAKKIEGYDFISVIEKGVCTGAKIEVDGKDFPWGFESGGGEGWKPAIELHKGYGGCAVNIISDSHVMRPAQLPAMYEKEISNVQVKFCESITSMETERIKIQKQNNLNQEVKLWKDLLSGGSITIEPDSFKRIIIDLDNYYCAYPVIVTTGGKDSMLRMHWEEAFYDTAEDGQLSKSNRDAIDGKIFKGVGDIYKPDGGKSRRFDSLWWHAGRYIELIVKTCGEPLIIEAFKLIETGYPLRMESSFNCSDERFKNIIPVLFRSLQMCAHETYMDCPYYEQRMYVGDTRLQVLATYAITSDNRLPVKAVELLEASRYNLAKMINCAYPQMGGGVIPSFCLWWVAMVHDFAMWRRDKAFIKNMLPGVRATLESVLVNMNEDGLVKNLEGWNFIDWCEDNSWNCGIPPHGEAGINCIFNLQALQALLMSKELEEYAGEPELAAMYLRRAYRLRDSILKHFWVEEKGLFSDDLEHKYYSEHSQSLAIICRTFETDVCKRVVEALGSDTNLAPATIYFSHYVFEAFREHAKIEEIIDRMKPWFTMKQDGMKTTPEIFSPMTRSDCHAWGAHPLYHYFTSILGIRPGSMEFTTVEIIPGLGSLTFAEGSMVHPDGEISVCFELAGDKLKGVIVLPDKLTGVIKYNNTEVCLKGGRQEILI